MNRTYFLGVCTMILSLASFLAMDASAQPHSKGRRIINSGNTKATGGNGGAADGKNAQGGNGGAASAKGGTIHLPKHGTKIQNSGNTDAKGGNGGNAKGDGAKGGNGGDASAHGGDIGTPTKKHPPIDPGKGNGKGKGKGKDKDAPKAGGGTGGSAKAGDTSATGGNGGNANGKGAKGGNGGDAIAVSGNGNTVINGNNNKIIGKVVNNNISLSLGGGGGGFGGGFVTGGGSFAQGGFGGDGSFQGAPGSAIASSPSETVITNDGSPAVAQGGNGKDNVEEGDGEVEQVFTKRFLKVKNDSGVAMKVFVQYRGQDDNKKWAWFPADPNDSKNAVTYNLQPSQEMFLQDKETKLSASRVRIWGVADGQNWFDYRDQDLWVVPEMDQGGQHRYQATEMRTFTFVFPKQDTPDSK